MDVCAPDVCKFGWQVRNNIMVALTDMTVQYTALVDAHVPRLAACLVDPHELVRRQTLALLASLLSRVRAVPKSINILEESNSTIGILPMLSQDIHVVALISEIQMQCNT